MTLTLPLDELCIVTAVVRAVAGPTHLHTPSDIMIEPGAGDCETILA